MNDILKEISDKDLLLLGNIYKKHVNWAPHVLSLIHTGIQWKKAKKYGQCIRFFSVGECWKTDGTVIVLMEFNCYDIFVFTLDEECSNLRQGLTYTNLLNFTKHIGSFFCVHEKHISLVLQVMKEKNVQISYKSDPYLMFTLLPEKHVSIECPPSGVHVKKINEKFADQINSYWSYSSLGSDRNYLAMLLELNGGFGVFLGDNNNEMAAWIVKHCLGHIGMLQTKEEHTHKGYGRLVTQFLIEEIRREGHYPFATIHSNNIASIRMFEKLGFCKIGTCAYLNFGNK